MTVQAESHALPTVAARRRRAPLLVRSPLRVLVFTLLLLLVLGGAFAPLLAPHSYDTVSLTSALRPPEGLTGDYILGTDSLGRDLLSRLLFGLRTSLLVASGATLMGAAIGITVGLIAGYAGHLTDILLMRLVDLVMAVPGIVMLLFLAFFLGPGVRTTILILGALGWVPYARMVRAEMLVVQQQTYMDAARVVGCSPLRAALRHALPQMTSLIIVLTTLQFGQALIAEASVSFLGFGVQPPDSSLGLLVKEGKDFLSVASWLAIYPIVTLFVLVLVVNLTGDELAALIDPVRRSVRQKI
jgi:peptide/nickel transport system permease protein